MKILAYKQLNQNEKKLLDAAESNIVNAYNPYNSQTKVATAVLLTSGEIIVGASMVNDSSPSSICAERAVIVTANSLGKRDIVAMAIIGAKASGPIKDPVTPCGACRQVMQEAVIMSKHDMVVIASNTNKDKIIKTTLSELLPLPYSGGLRK